MVAALSSSLYVLDAYGPVAPTPLTPPVRQGLGKYGDGLFVEEATTNICPNPFVVTGGASVNSNGTATFDTTKGITTPPTSLKSVMTSDTAVGYQGVTFPSTGTWTIGVLVYVEPGSLATTGWNFTVETGTAVATQTVVPTATVVTQGRFIRLVSTYNVTTAGTCLLVVRAPSVIAGSVTYCTGFQAEKKGYATSVCSGGLGAGYSWAGTANSSNSLRAAAAVVLPTPSTLAAPLTVCAWVRVGLTGTLANRFIANLSAGGTAPALVLTNGNVQFTSNVDVAAVVSLAISPGDLLFVAGTLAADKKTYTVSVASNGGALASNTAAASGTSYTGSGSVFVGSDSVGAEQLDGVVEQVLLYNAALSSAELAALAAATSETAYASDPRIVLAAATGTVRGTTNAETAAGTGQTRSSRTVPCLVEEITPNAANPDDDAATHKITVAAGSGIGAGQLVGSTPSGPYGNRWSITRTFQPGGVYDELLCTAI